MRIVVDTALNTGSAEYQNMGDVSMLQVAVARLKRCWPDASIEVITESPDNLTVYCPGTSSLSRAGRDRWVGDNTILGGWHRLLPKRLSTLVENLTRTLRLRWPTILKRLLYLRLKFRDVQNGKQDLAAYLRSLRDADLFVVAGSGGFTDDTRAWNIAILNTIEDALHRDIPVALFGQGVGPLTDADVMRRARKIFPFVNFIALRGGRGGMELLKSMGADTSRVLTTGDEAIELAYDARREELGQGIGVNLRVASYSNVAPHMVERIKPVLHEFAKHYRAPLVPVPIAFHSWANDHLTIQKLLAGFDDRSDGGVTLDTPVKVIKQVGLCRVVVTGAYHAAVFALSQGIPVVCLAKSQDYVSKFLGLEDQFGCGCETVFLRESDFAEELRAALDRAWQSAELVRESLLKAALRQIRASQGAYERVVSMVGANGNNRAEKQDGELETSIMDSMNIRSPERPSQGARS